MRDQSWQTFLIDLVLLNMSRSVRAAAVDNFLMLFTWSSNNQQTLQFSINLLFEVINTTVMENAKQSNEYFHVSIVNLHFKIYTYYLNR